MNDRQKKQSLKLEKTQAVDRRNMTRRIKQFFVLAIISLPIILYLSGVLTKAGVNDAWSIVIFCAILVVLWCVMLVCDKLILKRAKKIRQIKNAQAVVDKYNAEVVKRREEELAAAAAEARQAEAEKVATVKQETLAQTTETLETAQAKPENKNEATSENSLQNQTKNVIINNEEKKNKLKQKKYGGFNNKRKK